MREWPYGGPPTPARKALLTGVSWLKDAGIDGAERDGRILLAAAMGIAPDRLTLHMSDVLTPDQMGDFLTWVLARKGRKPVARILCRRLFWGRWFEVTSDTLDPRPETETLIACALKVPFANVLDLGTGTGILAVTLLAERPDATGVATDISPEALKVAERNARAHNVADRLWVRESDWFSAVGAGFDLIVSNPPYIAAAEMADLAPEVRDHDPRIALTDEGDGLGAYRTIASGAALHLSPEGLLMVEIGVGQGPAVSALFRAAGLEDVAGHADLDGRERVISAKAPGQMAT